MATDDERFLQRLLATFRLEAEEHLAAMSSLLLELEQADPGGPQAARLEALFREAHSLKGAARSVNLVDVEAVCQALERVLSAMKRLELMPLPSAFDALHTGLDGLRALLAAELDGHAPPEHAAAAALVRGLDALLQPAGAAAPPTAALADRTPPLPAAAPPPDEPVIGALAAPPADTVRISTAKLEALLIQAEELLAFKFSASHLTEELVALGGSLSDWRRHADKSARHLRAVRRAMGRPRLGGSRPHDRRSGDAPLAQLLEAVERDELFLKTIAERFAQLERAAAHEQRALAGRVDQLLEDMKQALMQPFAGVLEGMPKLVRDLSRDSGKEADLVMVGTALEVDRRILEQLKTPLIHLVRNAMDHGIEMPADRLRGGRPARGRILIEVAPHEGSKVEVVVADDGRGIDPAAVKARAAEMGLVAEAALAGMGDAQARALVFESGLSTRRQVTDLSGHGLGLAIVREKIEALGGSIALEAPPEGGTRFRIVLPTTLATFRGLLVSVGERPFVLPMRHVERVARIATDEIRSIENHEAIELEGRTLALARLGAVLGLPEGDHGHRRSDGKLPLAVLSGGGRSMAFAVDEVVGDQEVLVKPLSAPLRRLRNVAGLTVLGAGRVVPLLDVTDLLKSAQAVAAAPPRPAAPPPPPHRHVLVVEDSITSRTLLKGILESAGYRVSTAVDGLDALHRLQREPVDVVVSDVEMPRLDGIELITRIRADRRFAGLPVVLVTGLDSAHDRARGLQAGANAYIVKGSFDQGNLLAALQELA
jgi:two-component system chemotaxis sensor kinase CheA